MRKRAVPILSEMIFSLLPSTPLEEDINVCDDNAKKLDGSPDWMTEFLLEEGGSGSSFAHIVININRM